MAKHVDTLTAKARRTRQHIIQAARDIVGRKGVGGVNVMEVCAKAQVGRTSFYNYFDDVDELVLAVAAHAAETIKAQFDALHDGEPRGLGRLEKCLHMLLAAGADDPDMVLLITSLAASKWPIRDQLRREILQELEGAYPDVNENTQILADYLTSAVLALCRDIASGRAPTRSIPALVSMLMAATGLH